MSTAPAAAVRHAHSHASARVARMPQPYASPYTTGAVLGLVLLGAFVLVGRGLGASGAFASVAADVATTITPGSARASSYFARYLGADGSVQLDWLVVELAGVALGGYGSARFAGRARATIERGPHISDRTRITLALAGGALMGLGAVLARRCTSGQALTGGALLSVGSWIFMAGAFAAAYVAAPLLRRTWR
jgi:uncharacterized membrane protein YedE/YeeE